MRSFQPPYNGAYQPHELATLDKAFNAVWEVLSAHRQQGNEAEDKFLREAVSDRLCTIASVIGTDDMEKLRSATLESFSVKVE
jgi:hypothetical protein